MTVGLYRAAVAMVGHERRMDAVASNIANVGTTGFKRSRTARHEFKLPGQESRAAPGQVTRTKVDWSQGDIYRTGHPFDLALSGPGFFALDGPQGEVYTRDGEFSLTEEGVLVNRSGLPVTWETRGAAIDPAGLPIVVAGDGAVQQGDQELGRLRLVDFEDHAALVGTQDGNWAAPPRLREVTHTASVQQHSLEQSNALGTEEIIEMIGVQRSFESTANLIKSIQRSYSRLTRST